MQKLIEELKEKLAKTTQESLSAEERSKLMEAAMQAEEKRQEVLHVEISQMSLLKFKNANELHQMKLRKRNMDTEMQVWHSPKYRYDTVRNTGMTQSELRNTGTIQSISLCLFTGQDITEHSHFDWHVSGFPGWAGGLQKSLLGNICWSSIFQSVAMQKAEQQLIHNGSKT